MSRREVRSHLGPGAEFDRIRRILAEASGDATASSGGGPARGSVVGPGDDGCLLRDGLVVSTDLALEGVHFRLDWISAEEAGFRAAAAGMSDLAAMAAEPIGVLASVAAPGDGSLAELLMRGVARLAGLVGAPLLGGDLTRSEGALLVDIVSVGRTEAPLLRSGARVGDELWVTGALGGAAAAAALWRAGRPVPPPLRQAFTAPVPRISEARWLVAEGAGAGLDLSDGIAGDAGHLSAASGVGVVLEERALPLHPAIRSADLPPGHDPLALALHGGDDYELLVSAPEGILAPRVASFTRRFDLPLTRVGRIVRGEGVSLASEGPEGVVRLGRGGFDHFEGRGSG